MCIAVLGILGGVLSGIGAMAQANAAAANAEAQAAMQERQALIERTTGSYKAERQAEKIKQIEGNQRANYAASGLALTGSPQDIIEDSATQGALDIAAIRWNSRLNADNLNYSAKVSRMNASNARAAAPIAFLTPVIGSVARFGGSFGGGMGATA